MELFCFKNIAHHFRMKGKTWAIPKDDIIVSVDGRLVHKVILQEDGKMKICTEDLKPPRFYNHEEEVFRVWPSLIPAYRNYNLSMHDLFHERILPRDFGRGEKFFPPRNISISFLPTNSLVHCFRHVYNNKIMFDGIREDVGIDLDSSEAHRELFSVTRYSVSDEKYFCLGELFENGVFDWKDHEILVDATYHIFFDKFCKWGMKNIVQDDEDKFKIEYQYGEKGILGQYDLLFVQWIRN